MQDDFIRLADALKRNKTLIQADQREYQRDLETKFTKFTESLQPLLSACKQSTIIDTTLTNNKRYMTTYMYIYIHLFLVK